MSDLLGEALAHTYVEAARRRIRWPASFKQQMSLLAAARYWHTLTKTEPRQLWSWNESGKRKVMEPGRFYVVPVDALSVTDD